MSSSTLPHTPAQEASFPASDPAAPIQEVFSSIQGEGIFVGVRQVFVRFAHCHLHCAYCDTPMTSSTGQCHWYGVPGQREAELIPNPVSPGHLSERLVAMVRQSPHHSVSFTGGEPLLYHRFLAQVLPTLQPHVPIYLETSGTQPEFLAELLPWVDIIAMDIKLPSSTREPACYGQHDAFYRLARSNPNARLFIKLVVNSQTTLEEMTQVRAIVTDTTTPIILQPETPLPAQAETRPHPTIDHGVLFSLQDTLLQWFPDTRVIPQTHKYLALL